MNNLLIQRIQRALDEKGFMPGQIDGIWGRKTIAAVKAFQQYAGLTADGIVGPNTSSALFGEPLPASNGPLIPWLAEAENLLGIREVLGGGDNAKILDWANDLGIPYAGDDIPWCGLFVAHCLGSTLPEEALPSIPLRALAWEKFGTSIKPRPGAVMVFWRDSPHSGNGHVGFYVGEDKDSYKILGGNQSNSVSYAWIAANRLVDARWPHGASALGGGSTVVLDRVEDLSTREA